MNGIASRVNLYFPNGRRITFNMADGVNQGAYVDSPANINQQSIWVRDPNSSFSVFFRPEANLTRSEVVIELGGLYDPYNIPLRGVPRYRAVVETISGEVVDDKVVDNHCCFSRWRWQSKPRPVITTTAAAIAAGLLPNIKPGQYRLRNPTSSVARYAKPLDLAGVNPDFMGTGEKPQTGPITDAQGEYIATGNPLALQQLLAQGECGSGTVPYFKRDLTTGAPINFDLRPNATWVYGSLTRGDSFDVYAVGSTTDATNPRSPFAIDVAHDPNLNYVPWVLTHDPYFLEGLQHQVAENHGQQWPHDRLAGKMIVFYKQTRAYAWGLRNLACVATATPEVVPSWLLPKSYWRAKVANNLQWFTDTFVASRDPGVQRFRLATIWETDTSSSGSPTYSSSWMMDFLHFVMGWMIQMGYEDWRGAYEWKLVNLINRVNGASGWDRAMISPYIALWGPGPTSTSGWYQDWASASRVSMALAKPPIVSDQSDRPNRLQNPDYLCYARAALVQAIRLGHVELVPHLRWIDEQMARNPGQFGGLSYKWSMAVTSSSAENTMEDSPPVVVVDVPPVVIEVPAPPAPSVIVEVPLPPVIAQPPVIVLPPLPPGLELGG